jgi:transketolase
MTDLSINFCRDTIGADLTQTTNKKGVTEMDDLILCAKNIRRNILRMLHESGDGHAGCALSIVDILTALYFNVLNIDPANLLDEARDRFILSKGHAVVALYATLVERGIAPADIIEDYCRDGSVVASHASRAAAPGIEVSTGSGGHGLPIANGMALALRSKHSSARIFVLAGDGELAEGSMWEAIAFAGFHGFHNLKLIIDANGFQSEGRTRDILDLTPMGAKLRAFRWDVEFVNGHNVGDLTATLNKKTSKPYVVIANTTKGKGVSFMEGKYEWHHIAPNQEQYELAIKELT